MQLLGLLVTISRVYQPANFSPNRRAPRGSFKDCNIFICVVHDRARYEPACAEGNERAAAYRGALVFIWVFPLQVCD